jgi:hypothetical protein
MMRIRIQATLSGLVMLASLNTPAIAAPGQAFKPIVKPAAFMARVNKLGRAKPTQIPTLAGARNIGMAVAQGNAFKVASLKKHIRQLVAPEMLATHQKPGVASSQQPGNAFVLRDDDASILPVAFFTPSPAAVSIANQDLERYSIWHSAQAEVLIQDNSMRLSRGEVLLHVTKPMLVTVRGVDIQLKKGVIALVGCNEKFTRIANLTDEQRDSILVQLGDHSVTVYPGRECVVAPKDCLSEIRQSDRGGRRKQRTIKLNDCLSVHVAEVSIPSLIRGHDLLRRLYHSDEKTEHRVVEKLVRTAACLAHCNRSAEGYSWE